MKFYCQCGWLISDVADVERRTGWLESETGRRCAFQCERCGRIQIETGSGIQGFLPDAPAWGLFEPSDEAFLGYLDEQPLFGAFLAGVRHCEGVLQLDFLHEHRGILRIAFEGVSTVRSNRRLGFRARYLGEWRPGSKANRYRLDGWSSDVPGDVYFEMEATAPPVISVVEPMVAGPAEVEEWNTPESGLLWHIPSPLPEVTPNHVLKWAVRTGQVQVAEEALRDGLADPNLVWQEGWRVEQTVLAMAASRNDTAMVRLLLASGADPSLQFKRGKTALMAAASKGHLEAVRLLLDAGAERYARCNAGKTAWRLARDSGHLVIADLLHASGAKG